MTTLKFFSGNFYYVSNSESTFLDRIRFVSEISFKKSNSVWKIAPKSVFVNWHCKNLKVAMLVLSWKTCLWKSYFYLKKPFFNQNFWRKSDFEPLLFKTCQTLSQFSTTRQLSNRKFYRFRKKNTYNASDFEVKLFCKKTDFDERFALGKPFLDFSSTWRRQFLQLCALSKTTTRWSNWEKTGF